MLRIAICDDDAHFAQHALLEVQAVLDKQHIQHCISVFQTGRAFLEAGFFDLVFLDIEMQGLSGLETAETWRKHGNQGRIVFLTSHKQYVFSAFDVAASHYLLKPLDVQKLAAVLMHIVHAMTAEAALCYTVKCGTQVHRVPFSHIQYVEIFGRKISLYTEQAVFTFNGRLEELEQIFPAHFFRSHKSYLVNLAKVIRYDKETAMLQNGQTVPIARRKHAAFGTAFLAFLQEEGEL